MEPEIMARRKGEKAFNLLHMVNAAFSGVILVTAIGIEHRLTALEVQVMLLMEQVKVIQKTTE